jgi:hypothetical protein
MLQQVLSCGIVLSRRYDPIFLTTVNAAFVSDQPQADVSHDDKDFPIFLKFISPLS